MSLSVQSCRFHGDGGPCDGSETCTISPETSFGFSFGLYSDGAFLLMIVVIPSTEGLDLPADASRNDVGHSI